MLSYRHAFHAGNHADILKHYTFSLVLDYFNQKDKPYCVIDTHAGTGMYALNAVFSQKNKEFETGISHLINAKNQPNSVQEFTNMVQSFNTANHTNLYPGSPKIAAHYLRKNDKLHLFELHPNDYKILTKNFSETSKQTKIIMGDGFDGIKAILPPTAKRAITIIDPPYEDKKDYQRVVNSIQESLKRFSTGTYIVWYPLLVRPEPEKMVSALRQQANNWLNVTLSVNGIPKEGFGMFGSGLLIINPPWTLPNALKESLPYLTELLGQDNNAEYQLEYEIN
jgi:23S rRNA (adenine2030-N6)-methyltransferase